MASDKSVSNDVKCDHNPYSGGKGRRWMNIIRTDNTSELLECGGCHEIIERTLDLINNPLKFENVDVEITGWSPTQIIIRKDGKIIDFIEVQDEGGYEGSYNVHNVRNLAAIKQSKEGC